MNKSNLFPTKIDSLASLLFRLSWQCCHLAGVDKRQATILASIPHWQEGESGPQPKKEVHSVIINITCHCQDDTSRGFYQYKRNVWVWWGEEGCNTIIIELDCTRLVWCGLTARGARSLPEFASPDKKQTRCGEINIQFYRILLVTWLNLVKSDLSQLTRFWVECFHYEKKHEFNF